MSGRDCQTEGLGGWVGGAKWDMMRSLVWSEL